MSRQIQFRRGTADEHKNFTGADGEITVDTTNKTIRVHDGTTPGGTMLARKSEISNLIIPDYASGITMEIGNTEQTFVCPSNGVVVIDTSGFNNNCGYIKINGTVMFNITTNGNVSFASGNAQFIVGMGDTVAYKSGYVHETVKPSTNTIAFYPFRAV